MLDRNLVLHFHCASSFYLLRSSGGATTALEKRPAADAACMCAVHTHRHTHTHTNIIWTTGECVARGTYRFYILYTCKLQSGTKAANARTQQRGKPLTLREPPPCPPHYIYYRYPPLTTRSTVIMLLPNYPAIINEKSLFFSSLSLSDVYICPCVRLSRAKL